MSVVVAPRKLSVKVPRGWPAVRNTVWISLRLVNTPPLGRMSIGNAGVTEPPKLIRNVPVPDRLLTARFWTSLREPAGAKAVVSNRPVL